MFLISANGTADEKFECDLFCHIEAIY